MLRVQSLQVQRCAGCDLVYTDLQPRTLVLDRYLNEYDLADHFGAVSEHKRVLSSGASTHSAIRHRLPGVCSMSAAAMACSSPVPRIAAGSRTAWS